MRHPAIIAILVAGCSAFAYPGATPTSSLAQRASSAETSGTFVAVGLNTTVEINGQKKSCTSLDDIVMFDLGPNPLDALNLTVWSPKTGGDSSITVTHHCTLTGSPLGGAEFMTAAGSCFIRSMNDGSMESYGVTLKCDYLPYGGTCKQKYVSATVPAGFEATDRV